MLTTDPALQQLVSDRVASLYDTAARTRNARPRSIRTTFRTTFRRGRPGSQSRPFAGSAGAIPGIARPPAPFTDTFARWAETLGASVAERGIDRHERAVAALVKLARRHCLSPDLVGVVGDRTAAAVARERALGTVLVELAGRALPETSRGRDIA